MTSAIIHFIFAVGVIACLTTGAFILWALVAEVREKLDLARRAEAGNRYLVNEIPCDCEACK